MCLIVNILVHVAFLLFLKMCVIDVHPWWVCFECVFRIVFRLWFRWFNYVVSERHHWWLCLLNVLYSFIWLCICVYYYYGDGHPRWFCVFECVYMLCVYGFILFKMMCVCWGPSLMKLCVDCVYGVFYSVLDSLYIWHSSSFLLRVITDDVVLW